MPCNSDYKNNPQGFEGIIFLCVFYGMLLLFCGILCKEKMKESSSAMKKIIVINTGGTIAMSEDRSTGNVTPTSTNPLTNSDTIFAPIASVVVEDLFNLPSPHMTEEKMWEVQKRILKAQQEGFDGAVVTHGTDTLEETAYFLELTTDGKFPIVLTGAMRSSNEIGADGLANLRSAIITVTSPESVDKGVLVVMNDEVHAATYVTKTHTTNVATFQTPTFGPLGLVSKSEVIYFQKFLHHEYYPIQELVDKVYLLKAYAGMDSMLFDAIADSDANGLVIEALGAGNLPPTTLPGLQRCLDKGIPVVLVSRAFNGVTYDVYNYLGGGKQLHEAGVIFTTGLSGQKARVKLSVLLSAHANRETIIRAFQV